jgi:hypothetical protein
VRGGTSTPVPFIDLYSVIPQTERISLLKCDIEGAEQLFLEVYRDLLLRVDAAVIEFHLDRCDIRTCFQHLRDAGLVPESQLRATSGLAVHLFTRAESSPFANGQ